MSVPEMTLYLLLLCTGVLRQVLEACVVGAVVVDVCEMGDKLILEETNSVYKKEKDMKKGGLLCISDVCWVNTVQRR